MSAYRCTKKDAEVLPLALWTDKPALPNASKVQNLARRMIAGEAFGEVGAVIGGGGFWYVDNTEDQYMAAASLNAGFDHIPAQITASPFGPSRRAQ